MPPRAIRTPENTKKLAEYDAKVAALAKQLADHISGIATHRQEWLESLNKSPQPKEPESVVSIDLRANDTAHIAFYSKSKRLNYQAVGTFGSWRVQRVGTGGQWLSAAASPDDELLSIVSLNKSKSGLQFGDLI